MRAWFATAQEHTSNFCCLPLEEQGVEVQEACERAMQMDEEEVALEQWQAQGLRRDQRGSFQKAICYGRGPLNTLRKLGKKRASKEQREAGIVFRAGVSATQLVYPQDVPKLAAKKGRTYDPRSQKDIFPSCDDYVYTKMHLEKQPDLETEVACRLLEDYDDAADRMTYRVEQFKVFKGQPYQQAPVAFAFLLPQ